MLSRATAALKARVTNLEVPWSSQGWMEQGLGARAKRSRTAERPGKAPPLAARLPRRFARSQRRSASGHSPRRDPRESRRASGYAPWGAAAGIMAPPPRPRAHAHAAPGPSGPGGDAQRRGACPLEGWPEVPFHWCSMGGRQIGGVLTVGFCHFGAPARWVFPRLSTEYSRSWAAAATDSFRV